MGFTVLIASRLAHGGVVGVSQDDLLALGLLLGLSEAALTRVEEQGASEEFLAPTRIEQDDTIGAETWEQGFGKCVTHWLDRLS